MYKLRDYQISNNACVDAAHSIYPSVLSVQATGTGKTVSFVDYGSRFEGRKLVICPFITLISQAAEKIERVTGVYPAIEQADLHSNESEWAKSEWVVASKSSLCSGRTERRYKRFVDIALVIYDEAHLSATQPNYEMLRYFMDLGALVLGVTATPKRHDKTAMGQLFEHVAFDYGIQQATQDGWLCPVRPTVKTLKSMNLEDIKTGASTHGGQDFQPGALGHEMERHEVIYEICEAIQQETEGKVKTVVYCVSVRQAQLIAERLVDSYGIKADWICADTTLCTTSRKVEAMDRFTQVSPGIAVLANVGMLTTGWDFPGLRCIVNARPTKSRPLFEQIFGRVTRVCEVDGVPVVDRCENTPVARHAAIAESEKKEGRFVDLVDGAIRHKLITSVDILGGDLTLEDRVTVLNELVDKPGARDFDHELAAAIKARREKEAEEERERIAKTKAEAKFTDQSVDMFGNASYTNHKSRRGEPATDKQRKYMCMLGVNPESIKNLTKGQAGAIIDKRRKERAYR